MHLIGAFAYYDLILFMAALPSNEPTSSLLSMIRIIIIIRGTSIID